MPGISRHHATSFRPFMNQTRHHRHPETTARCPAVGRRWIPRRPTLPGIAARRRTGRVRLVRAVPAPRSRSRRRAAPPSGPTLQSKRRSRLMPGMTVPSGRVNGWLTTTLRPAGHSSVTANPDPSPSVSYSPTSLLPCSYHSHMCSVNDPSSCSSYMTVSSSAILELDVLGERGGRVVFVFDPPCRVVHPQHLFT